MCTSLRCSSLLTLELKSFAIALLSVVLLCGVMIRSFGSTRHHPHVLHFQSLGDARIQRFKSGERSFTAQLEVTDGESVFEGAKGTITMNGRMFGANRVEALVTGVIHKEPALKSRRFAVVWFALTLAFVCGEKIYTYNLGCVLFDCLQL